MKTRKFLTVKQKLEILKSLKNGKTQAAVSRDTGIPRQTVSKIWLQQEMIQRELDKHNSGRKKFTQEKYEMINSALLEWYNSQRSQNISLNGPTLQDKAKYFAEQLKITNFKASNGWLEKWKSRHGISFRPVSSEEAAVDLTTVSNWFQEKWAQLSPDYSPTDVFNCDETGLFWKMMPDKSLTLKNEICSGGKMSEERITVLLACNMTGTEKLIPLVVGKYEKPGAFKGLKTADLPVHYRSNSKSWITSAIFGKWLKDLDSNMSSQNRNIVLLLDNCPAHPPKANLKNIRLVFLPPNTTSVSQPLNQGIIQNFKFKYRDALLRTIIGKLDMGESEKIDMLASIILLINAWNDVSASTISNCFRKSGFGDTENAFVDDSDVEIMTENLPVDVYAAQSGLQHDLQEMHDAFLNVDADIITSEPLTDANILEQIANNVVVKKVKNSEQEDFSAPIVLEPLQPQTATADTLKALHVVKQWFMQHDASNVDYLRHISNMEDYVLRYRLQRVKKTVSDFIKNKKCKRE
ncbi:hypothetical protein CHUAL_002548 [Chamberlinius hualienensis]